MTPKEKAKELLDKYFWKAVQTKKQAKECAIIAVDELIKDNLHNENIVNGGLNAEYWQEVKEEIEKL